MEAMETLTKADLSRHLMERLELGKKDADLLVNTFLESIIESLRTGEGVELSNPAKLLWLNDSDVSLI